MENDTIKVAIPVLRSRVAPAFNWCSRFCVFSKRGSDGPLERLGEIDLPQLNVFNRLESLKGLGVRTLICGALSPDLLIYGRRLGLQIVVGVAGEIQDVIEAFGRRELDQPRFRMPGGMGSEGCGPGAGRRGAGGTCTCPQCGSSVPHRRGIPCVQLRCPACGHPMTRSMRPGSGPMAT